MNSSCPDARVNDLAALHDQARSLLQQSPPAGLPPQAVAAAVEVLLEVATQLGSLHYYLLRDRSGGWGAFESEEILPEPWLQPLPGRWLAAYADLEQAIALQDRANRGEPIRRSPADLLEIEEVEVLRVLWIGLGLTRASGLIFLDFPSGSSAPVTAISTQELKRQLAIALRRPQSPPVA
ncbi:MAG: hypothetical protein AAFX40_02780 [Cyanobacteria bacterium J06639_1]